MSDHGWMHYLEADGQATCEQAGPATRDCGAVTCPACIAALKLRQTSAEGAAMLGMMAAKGVRRVVDSVNAAVKDDPIARGLLAGAREVLRASREVQVRGRSRR